MTASGRLCLLALWWTFLASIQAISEGFTPDISFPSRRKFEIHPETGIEVSPDALLPNEVNALRNISEFCEYFNIPMPDSSPITTRIGSETVEELPQAECAPELVTVPLDLPTESDATFFPTCVRVERCGGCCFASHHSCQPTRADTILVRVINAKEDLTHSSVRRRRVRAATPNFIVVEVVRHLQCGCDCKLQPNQCDPTIHDFNNHYCQCICKNRAEENDCLSYPDHYWDSSSCQCLCQNPFLCSSGLVFDHKTCSCVSDSLTETRISFLDY